MKNLLTKYAHHYYLAAFLLHKMYGDKDTYVWFDHTAFIKRNISKLIK